MTAISLNMNDASSERPVRRRSKGNKASPAARQDGRSPGEQDTFQDPEAEARLREYLGLFEQLFMSFREQVSECVGDGAEGILLRAEERVRSRLPDFDLSFSDPSTALQVLDLLEAASKEAPFLRRSRLREAALSLVADLYTRHYELLERFLGVEALEQFYYRMKK